jgi:hypothetical protein
VYTPLAAAGCSALFGLFVKRQVSDEESSTILHKEQETDTGSYLERLAEFCRYSQGERVEELLPFTLNLKIKGKF